MLKDNHACTPEYQSGKFHRLISSQEEDVQIYKEPNEEVTKSLPCKMEL